MSAPTLSFHAEANKLSAYLIGQECNELVVEAYEKCLQFHDVEFSSVDLDMWNRMMSNQLILALVDSGLALTYPTHILRKRIFLMLSILESDKEYTEKFLPQQRSFLYLIPLGLTGIKGAFLGITGAFYVKLNRIL